MSRADRIASIQAALDRAAMTPARKPQSVSIGLPIVRTPAVRDYAVEHERWDWLHTTLAKTIAVEQRPAVWAKIVTLGDGLGCSCGSGWRAYCTTHPMTWDDAEAWGVAGHNAVNRILGKRHDWTVEQARQAALQRIASTSPGP